MAWAGPLRLLRRDAPLILLDLAVVLVAYFVPLVLRFEGGVPHLYWTNFWRFLPAAAAIHLTANALTGLYGQVWRYASVPEARRILLAAAAGGGCVLAANEVSGGAVRALPLSVVAFGAVLTLLGGGAARLVGRLFADRPAGRPPQERSRVLIVGAGYAGAMVVKDLLRHPSLGLDPVALVDDDRRKLGRRLGGLPVLGGRDAIPELVRRLGVDQVLLAIPSATSELVREVAALAEEAGVALKVLPSVHETIGGRVTARDIRDLRIEDLLGRKQVETDLDAVAAMLRGRRVLVTGAGGSIGSEICRQVASFDPECLILLDHDETHLHEVLLSLGDHASTVASLDAEQRARARHAGVPQQVESVLADIRDRDCIFSLFARLRPEVVFHAAAHKHVPVLEAYPAEALATNVIGTANLADAAVATGVSRFVLISTDKAINPVSVMGASKRFAEQVVRSLQSSGETCFCAVRFGNVLGSRGSVIPTFFRQIARGGPVTVTDPGMTRYFMSVQEAVQLVLQAGTMSRGGEVFTLDMGEPVNILDLARKLIRLSGRVPDVEIPIKVTGVRPGEKLVEDIVAPDEEQVPSGHPAIVVSRPPVPDRVALRRALRELEALAREGRAAELAARMKALAASSTRPPAAPAGGYAAASRGRAEPSAAVR